MVIRVVSALAAAAVAFPAAAAERLPYDIVNFTRTPAYAPQIGYDVGGLLYDRVPDHVALGYRLDGLTGTVPAYRIIRDVGPLDYDTDGLLAVIYAAGPQDSSSAAAD
ncbi:hypothetical protein HFP57_09565 [Parasphingopyxis algicola]|uniref:hypothetical protein n=1 Tax=Parasphingopyxis algicola TaxID=2026624 RepID=UPI0015A0AB57|nr:hypothetical protein [Parasphingopyxis algicola]QLC25241.1 hypothetical protein HFP57_09565 [Parasphingopyxis algicola]